jgi:hypothetical protein
MQPKVVTLTNGRQVPEPYVSVVLHSLRTLLAEGWTTAVRELYLFADNHLFGEGAGEYSLDAATGRLLASRSLLATYDPTWGATINPTLAGIVCAAVTITDDTLRVAPMEEIVAG